MLARDFVIVCNGVGIHPGVALESEAVRVFLLGLKGRQVAPALTAAMLENLLLTEF